MARTKFNKLHREHNLRLDRDLERNAAKKRKKSKETHVRAMIGQIGTRTQ